MMNYQEKIEQAFKSGKLSNESLKNLSKWLASDDYAAYHQEIQQMIDGERWEELDDSFYKMIEFGTGGRRGPRGVGPNRINRRTIGESAQGLADYIREVGDPRKGVVISFDSRHGSKTFAREVAEVLAANDIHVYLYPEPRSTPQLSFSIRYLNTQAGCMISASHNPPSDNGIKVSWEDGGQVLPPHDSGIIQKVSQVGKITRLDLETAVKDGKVTMLDASIDEAYIGKLCELSLSDARDAKIAYSPLHGVGATNVVKLLEKLAFDIVTVPEQMVPDPDFSTVKNRLPNPELPDALEAVTRLAAETGAAVAMASDPDADRLGATVPCPPFVNPDGWMFLTGNQLGVLMLDHVLRKLVERNEMPAHPVVIKTIVTTEMLDALCRDYHVEVIKDLLVGFKYIAEVVERLPEEKQVIFTTEESHGFNRGTFVRDKDSAPAALHLAELACELKRKHTTIYAHLNDLYRKYGYFCEVTRSVYYHGKAGRETMLGIMERLRNNPPAVVADYSVSRIIDRMTNRIMDAKTRKIIGEVHQHTGNVMAFYFDAGGLNRVTARPSGTEPKIKFYAQLWCDVPADISDEALEEVKRSMQKKAEVVIESLAHSGE